MAAGEWCAAAVACVICGREWVATYPAEAQELECPGCGYMNAAPSDDADDASEAEDG